MRRTGEEDKLSNELCGGTLSCIARMLGGGGLLEFMTGQDQVRQYFRDSKQGAIDRRPWL